MITVTAAIIRREGKFLICRRKDEDDCGGYWEFPGGGVDEGETPDECIAREIEEELGVPGRPVSLFDATVNEDGRTLVLFYFFEIGEGTDPQPLDCAELRWVEAGELKGYRFLPADSAVLERLAARF